MSRAAGYITLGLEKLDANLEITRKKKEILNPRDHTFLSAATHLSSEEFVLLLYDDNSLNLSCLYDVARWANLNS